MIFEQYYLDCLSHASYLIADERTGRAVVVDPQRDVSGYLADAAEHGLTVERVIETHFHADFLSGHLELADRTGAVISYGPGATADFPIEVLEHGTHLSLGDVDLEVRSTPGHTPESISIVVRRHAGDPVPYGVLTGDTLFIGDVGRPDLLATRGVTAEEMARMLYRSTRGQLLTLPDATRVFPAHGAGSACGKSLSAETSSTIGEQRRTNYALADMSEDAFVEIICEGQPLAPPYFAFDATLNRQVRALLDEETLPPPLAVDEVVRLQEKGVVVVDTRDPVVFAAGHLRGSVNVGLGGRFAEYAGDVVPAGREIVLVGEPGTELEAKVRLARIGFDRVAGHLDEPLRAMTERPELVARSSRVTVAELAGVLARGGDVDGRVVVVDARDPGEVRLGSIEGAVHVPLPRIVDGVSDLDRSRPTVVFCTSGYRSAIAASALEANGFTDVSDLLGGYDAWVAAGLPSGTVRGANR